MRRAGTEGGGFCCTSRAGRIAPYLAAGPWRLACFVRNSGGRTATAQTVQKVAGPRAQGNRWVQVHAEEPVEDAGTRQRRRSQRRTRRSSFGVGSVELAVSVDVLSGGSVSDLQLCYPCACSHRLQPR